jgi:hypothetical protein
MKKLISSCVIVACLIFSGCGKYHYEDGSVSEWTVGSYDEDFVGSSSSSEVHSRGLEFIQSCKLEALNHVSKKQVSSHSETRLCNVVSLFDGRKGCVSNKRAESHDNYEIGISSDGRLKLNLNLAFYSSAAPARLDEMIASIRKCLPSIAEVWARYGVEFELGLLKSEELNSYARPAWRIALNDEVGRSNSRQYYFRGPENKVPAQYESEALCSMVLHETGHLLDLPDEYKDDAHPERKFISTEKRPWSAMADTWHHLAVLDFFPRHLATVFAPVCPKAALTVPQP